MALLKMMKIIGFVAVAVRRKFFEWAGIIFSINNRICGG